MMNSETQCMAAIFNDAKAVLRKHKDKMTYASMKEMSSMYDLICQVWRRLYKSTAIKLSMSRLITTTLESNGIKPPTLPYIMKCNAWQKSYNTIHLLPWLIMSSMRGTYTIGEKARACYAMMDVMHGEIKKHFALKHKSNGR